MPASAKHRHKPKDEGSEQAEASQQEETQEQAPQQEEQQQEEQPQEEQSQEEQPQEEQASEEEPQETADAEPTPDVAGDIRFPMSSSHFINGEVRTSAVCVTPQGCSILHCKKQPPTSFGGGRMHPRITATVQNKLIKMMGLREKQRKLAGQVVVRAREGDQNAMALMVLARENAQKGNPQAIASMKFFQEYVTANPVGDAPSFGEECSASVAPDVSASIQLANGPPITNSRVRRVLASFGSEHAARTLAHGIKHWNAEDQVTSLSARLNRLEREIFKLGRTIGQARAIQRVRNGAPLAALSKRVAWELGE